ncbi:MAG TPA: zinc-ribbon and DUF3426 domain-containing protein [Paenalcaligenes sp.]|nr:zinc-ribbon and DUF3426 domain-containing protein [Paenalcaligenes sp.]
MITLTTQCPECQTRFSVAGDELRRRKGLVRCIQCHEVFDGYDAVVSDRHSVETFDDTDAQAGALPEHDFPVEYFPETPKEYPPEIPTELPAEILNAPTAEPVFFIEATDEEADSAPLTSTEDPVWLSADPTSEPLNTDDEPDLIAGVQPETASALSSTASPVYAERRIDPPEFSWRASLARLAWRLLLGLLIVGALLQVAYVYRAQIALHAPFMRPALQSLCAYAGCKVPYLRALSAIDITYSRLSLEEQSTDDAGQQYLLQVGLNNTASVPQEWPTLLITFSDVSATVLARLVVTPEQYLSASQRNGPFLPGQVIDLRLQVEAQDAKINGFKVEKFFS